VLCGIGRSQAAIAAPTATSVIANMTTRGQRADPCARAGGHGICGLGPGGNPGGGGVFDMRRMLSPISNGGIQLSGANEYDGAQSRCEVRPRDEATSSNEATDDPSTLRSGRARHARLEPRQVVIGAHSVASNQGFDCRQKLPIANMFGVDLIGISV